MVMGVSQDVHERKHLVTLPTVHTLITIALEACESTSSFIANVEDGKGYVKDAVRVLYNLAFFDRPKYYIPGETAIHGRCRQQFVLWGGLCSLYYVNAKAKLQDVREFCDNTKTKDMDSPDLDAIAWSLRRQLRARLGDSKDASASETKIDEVGQHTFDPRDSFGKTKGQIHNLLINGTESADAGSTLFPE